MNENPFEPPPATAVSDPKPRRRKISLRTWGFIFILAAVVSSSANGRPVDTRTAAGRGAAFGAALPGVLFIAAGVVLIAVDFGKRRRGS
jgi:hypothetical protein